MYLIFFCFFFFFFFFNDTATTEIYTLSLHDALPICQRRAHGGGQRVTVGPGLGHAVHADRDRKSTRLNSSHVRISYAVFCLKKKKKSSHTSPPVNSINNQIAHSLNRIWSPCSDSSS